MYIYMFFIYLFLKVVKTSTIIVNEIICSKYSSPAGRYIFFHIRTTRFFEREELKKCNIEKGICNLLPKSTALHFTKCAQKMHEN